MLVYYTATGSFDDVDGGVGLASAIIYIVAGVLVMGVLHAVARFTSKRPRLSRVVIATIWAALLIFLVSSVLYFSTSSQEDGRQASIRSALQTCTVKSVEWTYTPQRTIIEYIDRTPYRMDGYVQPTQVEAMVREREARCEYEIDATFNGEPMRRYY